MKKAKLKRMLKDTLRQLAAARSPAPVDEGPTISEWLTTYRTILGQRGYVQQTLKNRGSAIKHIEALWGSRPIQALKPYEIAGKLKLLTPPTAIRVLSELKDFFAEAIANGAADINQATSVRPPKHSGLRQRLTLETWQGMRELAQKHHQSWVLAMLLLALVIGQRRADLAKVRFDDVVGGHLRIEQQKKARKKRGFRVAIPLSLRVDAIGMTVGEVIEFCRKCGAPGPTLLRTAGGKPLEMSSLSARFHELIVALLGPTAYRQYEWPSLHEVRSLCARLLVAQGMTPRQVQTLLGHKAEEMTRIYLDDRGLTEAEWKAVPLPA